MQGVTCSPCTGTRRGGWEEEEAKALRCEEISSPYKRNVFLLLLFLDLPLKKIKADNTGGNTGDIWT